MNRASPGLVLGGPRQTLRTRPPQVILAECNERATPVAEQAVPRILLDAGYQLLSLPFCWLRAKVAPIATDVRRRSRRTSWSPSTEAASSMRSAAA